jgi:hypothetical protein
MVKAMLATGRYNDQGILAHFTRPSRTINHREIAEVRTGAKHRLARAATAEQLAQFLLTWPDVDLETGLSNRGDELLVKAREAMIAAVHTFNGAGLTFRAEIFITTAVVAWTYLMHAWLKKEAVDYRHRVGNEIARTPSGAEKYWELGRCLSHQPSPVPEGVRLNLEFLLEIRHEIEHRSTDRIDDALSAKLQACCINFNDTIRRMFGAQYGLERRLPIALQFVTFDGDQRQALKARRSLPANIETAMDAFHERLTDAQQGDPAFAYRVAFVPKLGGKASKADLAIEFVTPGTPEAEEISRVLLKEVDKSRSTATQIVERMHEEGYPRFTVHAHTRLWQDLDAKGGDKGFGRAGDYPNTWVWFDTWVARVRAHCQENAVRYQAAQ